jgi:hypothetical protein
MIELCDKVQANKAKPYQHDPLAFWLPKIRWFFSLGYCK